MACEKCYERGHECDYPTTFGCLEGDYDCDEGCYECAETDECKYESGDLGALIYAFNQLAKEGKIKYNPFILKRLDD